MEIELGGADKTRPWSDESRCDRRSVADKEKPMDVCALGGTDERRWCCDTSRATMLIGSRKRLGVDDELPESDEKKMNLVEIKFAKGRVRYEVGSVK